MENSRDSTIMIGLLPGRGGTDLTLQDARGMITLLLTLERNEIVTVESLLEYQA